MKGNRTIDVLIETGSDGTYDVYFDPTKDDGLPFGLLGQGDTVQEAVDDFYASMDEMKVLFEEKDLEFPSNLEFSFSYDIPSFLAYYKGKLSLNGLGRLTGINPKQLNHYATGVRRPSRKTIDKIEHAMHTFGQEICQLKFT